MPDMQGPRREISNDPILSSPLNASAFEPKIAEQLQSTSPASTNRFEVLQDVRDTISSVTKRVQHDGSSYNLSDAAAVAGGVASTLGAATVTALSLASMISSAAAGNFPEALSGGVGVFLFAPCTLLFYQITKSMVQECAGSKSVVVTRNRDGASSDYSQAGQ